MPSPFEHCEYSGNCGEVKYFYATCARVPGKKAHCSQIAQMCRAFLEVGLDLVLLHPARSTHGDYRGASIEQWYGFEKSLPTKRLFCLDYMNRVPECMPHFVTSLAYRLMVSTFNRSLIRYLKNAEGDFIVYSRDLKVMRKIKESFPDVRAYLEMHMLRENALHKWEDPLIRSMDGIVVVTKKMKEMLRERGVPDTKILVEPNGVDIKNFPGGVSRVEARERIGLDTDRRYISFVGNFRALSVDRGLGTLIRTIPHVVQRYPDVTFLLVGGPMDYAEPYLEELRVMDVDERHYKFLDRRPYNEIFLWLAASDVLVHPVPEHPIYTNVTSPLKIFEYMTAKRPIVASNLPSIREVLTNDHDAILVAPGQPEAFGEAFLYILDNEEEALRLAENARRGVGDRTWEARARRIRNWLEVE